MPKSKHRKMNHAPQPVRANIAATTAATVSPSGTSVASVGTPSRKPQVMQKGPAIDQLAYVGKELKTIGIITVIIVAIIVVLYFVMR